MDKITRNKPLAQIAADHIVDYIMNGTVKKGERLPSEGELMEMLGVGRGTIREAIKILASLRVVEIRRGVGTFVCENMGVSEDPLGFQYIEDKYKIVLDTLELRMLIEPSLAAKAAKNATLQQISEIGRLCDLVEEKINNKEDYLNEDRMFHTKIAESSDNLVISNLLPIIHGSIALLMETNKKALTKETVITHRRIYEAIKEHNEKEAYDAMEEHLRLNFKSISK